MFSHLFYIFDLLHNFFKRESTVKQKKIIYGQSYCKKLNWFCKIKKTKKVEERKQILRYDIYL